MSDNRIRLSAGDDAVEIDVAAGARLASLTAGGAQRLVTRPPSAQDNPEYRWGVFVMAPWVGRVRDAAFGWAGADVELTPDFGPHAIHGLVADREWEADAGPAAADLHCRLDDAPWPFRGAVVRHRVALAPGELSLRLDVEAGEATMPAAAGWHPWFRRPDAGDLRMHLDAPAHLQTDDADVPTGAVVDVVGDTDLRTLTATGDRRLDHTYVDIPDGAVVQWPDLRLEMTFDGAITCCQVHTPAEGVCVEPQTAWPDAVNLAAAGVGNTGLATLAPGERLTTSVVWRWAATGS